MNPTLPPTPNSGVVAHSDELTAGRTSPRSLWSAPDQQIDAMLPTEYPRERALVLAGGGAAGNAWQIGLIAGLSDAGVDVTTVDLIIGTSSGSTVAAQVTSGTHPADLYAAILDGGPQPPRGGANPNGLHAPAFSGPTYMEWSQDIIAAATDAADMRRRMGAAALVMDTSDGTAQSRWRATVAARLPSPHWPDQWVRIPAINAQTGDPVVFDRHSGVDLVDAVAASTSNGFGPFPPYRVGEHRYLNGGYRRNENADLAAGFRRILVLSPFAGASRMPPTWGMDLATQVAELCASGSTVDTIFPEDRIAALFDAHALNPVTREPAARAGYDHGHTLAPQIGALWQ